MVLMMVITALSRNSHITWMVHLHWVYKKRDPVGWRWHFIRISQTVFPIVLSAFIHLRTA